MCFIIGRLHLRHTVTAIHNQSLVSTQEAELPVTAAVRNSELQPNQGEHVRPPAACTELLMNDPAID